MKTLTTEKHIQLSKQPEPGISNIKITVAWPEILDITINCNVLDNRADHVDALAKKLERVLNKAVNKAGKAFRKRPR